MARKIAAPKNKRPSNDGRNDLDILHPDRSLPIGGRSITVREYGFVQGLELQRRIDPIIKSLAQMSTDGRRAGASGDIDADGLMAVLADHAEAIPGLIAASIGQEEAWVRGLSDSHGQLLLMTWWRVNSSFFVRRTLRALARIEGAASAGPMSTPTSSPQATSSKASASSPGVS